MANDGYCEICAHPLSGGHEHKPDRSGLDDGPFLIGRAPRKRPEPKLPEELTKIRHRAWDTRRAMYGQRGHR